MASYRCYLLDYRDRIHTFIEIQADTDETAVERAKEKREEAWNLCREVTEP